MCKIGDVVYTNTESLEVGNYEIVCSVTSIGRNTKEVSKQIGVYEDNTSDNTVTEEESEVVENETTTE